MLKIYGIAVDEEKGFDVIHNSERYGEKILGHFENYTDACTFAKQKKGAYIRYWMVKESEG